MDSDPDVYNPKTAIKSELQFPLSEHGLLIAGSPTADLFDQQDFILGKIWAANIATALTQVKQTEQLHAREQELTRQNDRLEEFASVVSHDLRSPLNVAQGRLELAQEDCNSEHHNAIATAIDRMERIIGNMLWLSREGEDIGSTQVVSLHDAIKEFWMMVTGDPDSIEIADGDDRWEGTIDADHDRLCQLLENLFRNAVEHGGEGVTVSVGELSDGFYIEDDGLGIPPTKRDKVFNTGYSTSQGSTGFGMSIVKQIVEAHQWDIHINQSATGGARFEITGVKSGAE